ncbi:MAG: hypothetical protein GC159_22940 [Phycisphaera sp.]|nr:hypothetical protein [Phycisphaera sp.]
MRETMRVLGAAALVAAMTAVGCGKGDAPGGAAKPTSPSAPAVTEAAPDKPAESTTTAAEAPSPDAPLEPTYTELKSSVELTTSWDHEAMTLGLPAGWTVAKGENRLRIASIVPENPEMPQIAVSKLGIDYGGLEANLALWRSQVGIGTKASPEEMAKEITAVKVSDRPSALVDIAGPQGRMLLLVLPDETNSRTWFFKMSGHNEHVAQLHDAFIAIVKSIKLK